MCEDVCSGWRGMCKGVWSGWWECVKMCGVDGGNV